MKVNSISGLTCYLKDLNRTAQFYESIGSRRGIEGFYKDVVSSGLKPVSEPEVRPSGNREFVLRDPDGYKLIFLSEEVGRGFG